MASATLGSPDAKLASNFSRLSAFMSERAKCSAITRTESACASDNPTGFGSVPVCATNNAAKKLSACMAAAQIKPS